MKFIQSFGKGFISTYEVPGPEFGVGEYTSETSKADAIPCPLRVRRGYNKQISYVVCLMMVSDTDKKTSGEWGQGLPLV